MNQKERALEELEKMKERMVELENIIREPEGHPCVTPVTSGGSIIFNEGKQCLSVNAFSNVYEICSTYLEEDYRKEFQWVPIKREDLKVGDTAYRTDSANKDFTKEDYVAKILNARTHVYVGRDKNTQVSNNCWRHWYKLVPKN